MHGLPGFAGRWQLDQQALRTEAIQAVEGSVELPGVGLRLIAEIDGRPGTGLCLAAP